jgi:sRNA-binding regulator protein Hfq
MKKKLITNTNSIKYNNYFNEISFILAFSTGEEYKVKGKSTDTLKSVILKLRKDKNLHGLHLSKISSIILNANALDKNKTLSENKITQDCKVLLILKSETSSAKSSYKDSISTSCTSYNNDKTNEISFTIIFTNGQKFEIKGKLNDTVQSVIDYFNKYKLPNNLNKISIFLFNGKSLEKSQTLSENKISQGSQVLALEELEENNLESSSFFYLKKKVVRVLVITILN